MTPAEGSRSADRPAPASQVEAGRAAPEPVAGGLSLLTAAAGAVLLTVLIATLDETYEAVQENDGLARVDQPLLEWMVAHRSGTAETLVTWFTNVGGTTILPILVTLVVAVMAWRWRSWTPVVLMAVAAAGSVAMTEAGKDLAGRARPPQTLAVPPYETSPSFPSGHTLNSTVIAIVLAYLVLLHVESRVGRIVTVTLLVVYALAMGLSRVYLGHHWFTDVVAGFIAGAAWALVVILAHRLLLRVQHQRAQRSRGRRAD
ncbi:MAG TPA: phosphatase PAP2 family protein [Lapillicoccus sp.]|nr:phosphatase PAP2 family protein [Lapillicoccus sp.]